MIALIFHNIQNLEHFNLKLLKQITINEFSFLISSPF